MKAFALGFLRNRNFILFLAIILGLIFWQFAEYSRHLVDFAIILAITLSLSRIDFRCVIADSNLFVSLGSTLLVSFLLLGFILIGLAYLFLDDMNIIYGFIVLAAAPPAIAVIPFSYVMKANINLSVLGTLTGYALTFAAMPLVAGIFFQTDVDLTVMFRTLVVLIVVPFALSRVLRYSTIVPRTEKHYGMIINWCFFITTFSIVGLNYNIMLSKPEIVLFIFLITLTATFGYGTLIKATLRRTNITEPKVATYQLLGTMKNWSGAGIIALNLFGPVASLPSTIGLISGILYYVWISWKNESQAVSKTEAGKIK
jgi:bile acid:Na+ symporter, BASS family